MTLASGVTGTNYTDTGVTNGDTYFYVVVANTTVGASGNSPEASATPPLGVSGSYWTNTVTASTQGWNAGTNWSTAPAFPNAPQAVAIINNGIAANQTIALNQPIAAGSLYPRSARRFLRHCRQRGDAHTRQHPGRRFPH